MSTQSHISLDAYQRSIRHFAYFCMNYPQNFLEAFQSNPYLQKHLEDKFRKMYEDYGSNGVMIRFFLELDLENQSYLLEWIKMNYTGYTL